ncbi:Aste57867_8221 [Aphanomyces stellatus]|uniref:Aste57867_8221 protein n=1 Tax=Aphanomyces stellatus TaxID=120398 RepID=A0A485KJM9_9STRA|nr:hypothetical protein As57867_008190 [Aphanomyces stellatus]VFT85108.1 Aste57867_8221 [Aphanomyces stellatus]
MTRPVSQQKHESSVQRALKELGNAADLVREREKTVDLTSQLQAASDGPIDHTYVVDPAANRWGPDLQAASEMIPWPPQVLASIQRASSKPLMGFFPDIQHAWVAVDATTLVLWDYKKKADGVIACPAMSSPIISAGLVLPRSGTLFSDQVQYLLAVLTEVDIRLFALIADKTLPHRPWKVHDTLMTAPLQDSQLSASLVCMSKRILLGGVDGNLYEYVYSPNLPKDPSAKKFRQVQPAMSSVWADYLPGVVRDLIFPAAKASITSLTVDAPRQLLYALHDTSSHVSVFDLGRKDVVLVGTVDLVALASSVHGAPLASPVVSLSPLHASPHAHLVALTATGQRLYLSTSAAGGLRALFVRALPAVLSVSSSSSFVQLVARHDLCLLAQANHQLVAVAGNTSAAPAVRFVETLSTLPLLGTLHALVPLQASSAAAAPARHAAKRTADGAAKPATLAFLHDLGLFGVQFTAPAQVFLALTTAGVQTYVQRRPIDHVDTLLRTQTSSATALAPLAAWYGAPAVAAMLFGLSHNPAASHALFQLAADASPRGLAQYVAHVLAPVWTAPVVVVSPPLETIQATCRRLQALTQLLQQMVPYAVALHTDIPHLQPQHAALRDMHTLIGRCADALFGWLQLATVAKDWTTTTPPPVFHDVIGVDASAKEFQSMLVALAKNSPAVVGPLLAHSPTFFTVWEAAPLQGLQTIAAAKAAATLAQRDTLLQESLAQFRLACVNWPPTASCLQVLRHIVREYAAASFYYGVVELTVAVAALFRDKDACYEPLLALVAASSEAHRPLVRFAMQQSGDPVLHHAVLASLRDNMSALEDCAWTPVIKTYLHTHDPEWYVRLCIHHRDFDDAADLLWQHAHDTTTTRRSIGERATLVARALACVQADPAAAPQHARDIQDALDVFEMQTRIFDVLRHQKLAPDVLDTLNYSILNMSTLFNDYAIPYGLHTECLRILHACRTNEPQLIARLWKQLIFGFVPAAATPSSPAATWLANQQRALGQPPLDGHGAFEDGAWIQPLRTYVTQMGTTLLHSGADFVFPLQDLVMTLESLAFYSLQVMPIAADDAWVAKLFLDLKFAPSLLVGVYTHLMDTTATDIDGIHWLRGMHAAVAAAADRRPFAGLIHQHIRTLQSHPEACDQLVRWQQLLKGL